MKDYSELKMLAESVGEAGYHWGRRDWAVRQLERSCNHETILDIIAELEILKYDCKVANSCVNAEKKESKRIRDENESLKKDAARYRWLRDNDFDIGSFHPEHEHNHQSWFEYFDDESIDYNLSMQSK